MPIFAFKCRACGEEYEDFRNLKETEEKGRCIKCGSAEISRGEEQVTECGCGCGCGEAAKTR